jgi:hypothetical protein
MFRVTEGLPWFMKLKTKHSTIFKSNDRTLEGIYVKTF